MKVIYEPGDIVYNSNNYTYAIVLGEYNDVPKILEVGKDVFVNNPPKAALTYIGTARTTANGTAYQCSPLK